MRYPRFYEQIAARMCNAVKAGDVKTLQHEAAFCRSWGSELGLLGQLAEVVGEVIQEKPPAKKRAKPKAKQKEKAEAPSAPPPVVGGWVPS